MNLKLTASFFFVITCLLHSNYTLAQQFSTDTRSLCEEMNSMNSNLRDLRRSLIRATDIPTTAKKQLAAIKSRCIACKSTCNNNNLEAMQDNIQALLKAKKSGHELFIEEEPFDV